MPEYTTNLNIPKPTGTEYFNRTSYNATLDKIDEAASQASNIKIADANSRFNAVNVEGALDELFTNADNAQKAFAGVVGSPSAPGDTVTKITSDLQTGKNTLASNLTAKGTSASGTETLAALAAKVANVNTGKRFATGNYITSGSTILFADGGTGSYPAATINVTGLAFKPSTIVIYDQYGYAATSYSEPLVSTSGYKLGFLRNKGDFRLGFGAYINESSFLLPAPSTNTSYKWVAYE